MGTDRPYEQARNYSFDAPEDDTREPWIKDPEKAPKLPDQVIKLLRGYLAVHGDWREVTSRSAKKSVHSWEFTLCECPLCKATEQIVGHPRTPHG